MSSYRQIFYHIIFGTKYRKPTIPNEHCDELYKYITGIIQNKKCHLYEVNGIEDHIHISSDLHPSICLSDYIKDIKVASNIWMKETEKFPLFEGWQDGYGAFTHGLDRKEIVINYIRNQKLHHRKESFYDEFKRILIENGVDFDESYFL
jgi:REP element-mobilizing transposase RayT